MQYSTPPIHCGSLQFHLKEFPSYFGHSLLGTSQETRNLSLGIPRLPAQHFTHESSSRRNIVTAKTFSESNELEDCRGQQTEFTLFLFSRTDTCALREQYMLGAYRKDRNSLTSSSHRLLHLYWFRHSSIYNIRWTGRTPSPVHLKKVSFISVDQDILFA